MKILQKYGQITCIVAILILIVISCTSEQREPVSIDGIPDNLSFNTDIVPIFTKQCINCHKQGGTPPNLTVTNAFLDLDGGNYINIDVPEQSKLYKAITGSGSMTQYTTELQAAYILKWIQEGAEDN